MSYPMMLNTPKFGIALELGSKKGNRYPVIQEWKEAAAPGDAQPAKDASVAGTFVSPKPGGATWTKADQTQESGEVIVGSSASVFLSGPDLKKYIDSGRNKTRLFDLYA